MLRQGGELGEHLPVALPPLKGIGEGHSRLRILEAQALFHGIPGDGVGEEEADHGAPVGERGGDNPGLLNLKLRSGEEEGLFRRDDPGGSLERAEHELVESRRAPILLGMEGQSGRAFPEKLPLNRGVDLHRQILDDPLPLGGLGVEVFSKIEVEHRPTGSFIA
ncbi:MAG: hypothetical protein BWY86_01066 [Candidatus Aminicenantes bacterium ADurb.Bin508]|nr:MAG: hypothetical protein BWY86_01066 [Candidatus Aminicenantes bacterium ADurb.Bin508]